MKFALLLFFASLCFSQDRFFPFTIDQDSLAGAPDFSFLNSPLTPADRLTVRDGHFYAAGQRVRLFGANIAFGGNFPEPADAVRIAKRLRRLGFNLVRLHHMDSAPDRDPNTARSLLTTGPYPTLNPVSVARLRGFLDALRAEGIYVNLNLKVGYQFRPDVDDVPEVPGGAFPRQSKPLHMIHPCLIDLQTQYVKKVIAALKLQDDPVLGLVEINNESSLIYSWQTNQLDASLRGEYEEALATKWNSYLRKQYKTTADLRKAWGASEAPGSDILPHKWNLETHGVAKATVAANRDVQRVVQTVPGDVVMMKQVSFSLPQSTAYVAEVEMRADLPGGASRPVHFDVKLDVTPWTSAGSRSVNVSNAWQKFVLPVQSSIAMNGNGRLGLSIEQVKAPVYIRNAKLYPAGKRALDVNESVENGTIALPHSEASTEGRTNDYLLFLVSMDKAYLDAMATAVRDAGCKTVPIAGTQMNYGGLLNIDSHASLDYQDTHFYVDHYNFPNTAWDGRDWRFRDTSALATGLAIFQTLAAQRVLGKPFTVSEFNQPWPNTHGAESDPTLAAFAAFQDWDGLMHFAYTHGRDWDINTPNGFNLNGDWSKWVNAGQAAWIFRTGAVHAAKYPMVLYVSKEQRLQATRERRNGNIGAFLKTQPGLGLQRALAITTGTEPAKIASASTASSMDFWFSDSTKVLLIEAELAAGVFGELTHDTAAGPITVTPIAGRNFRTVLLTSLDGKRLSLSSHMLLSNPGYTLGSQPIIPYKGMAGWWTLAPEAGSSKPSGNLNGGPGPTRMERVETSIRFRSGADSLTVYPLDGKGNRLRPIPVTKTPSGFEMRLQADGQDLAPWYEFVAAR